MRSNSILKACNSLALSKLPAAIAALGLILSPIVHADVTISTLPPSTDVQPWGTPASLSTPTYGQVIVPPAGNPILKSATFYISNGNAISIPYTAYVFAWDGTKITGAALFTSSAMSVPPTGSDMTFIPVTLTGINTFLPPGSSYAVFLTTIPSTLNVGRSHWQTSPAAAYTSGKFIYNNSATFAGLFVPTPLWNEFGDFAGNATFSMTFGPVVPPVISKSFNPQFIRPGGTSTLTITIQNPNLVAMPGVGFTDNLPAGVTIAPPPTTSIGCFGGTGIATIGSGTISLVGTTIAASSTCTITTTVTSTEGIKNNATSNVVSAFGTGNVATARLTAANPPTISKAFGVAVIPLNGVTTLTLSITNPNPTVPLTAVSVVDNLPAGLKVATPSVVTNFCGGAVTAVAGSGSISLAGGSINAASGCIIAVNVTGVIPGLQVNVTDPITSLEGGTDGTATASITVGGNFLISYAANLTNGDSVVNLTNTGALGASLNGPGFGGAAGNICMNVYAFSPDEQLVACCSCLVTPNGLAALSINSDLISNTLTGVRPNSVVVKVVPTGAGALFTGTSCTNSAAVAGQNAANPLIVDGGLAWGTTIHALGTGFATTENPFRGGTLSAQELASITNRCTNIIGNGSTFGICRSCRAGGLEVTNR